MDITIQYLHHSGFAVKLDTTTLVFDYDGSEVIPTEFMSASENNIVFVSHKHKDHYSQKIWQWAEKYPNVSYILSDDIKAPKTANFTAVGPRQCLEIQNLTVSTLTSTDEGVAFLIEKDGFTLYFAGDLNWWHWNTEPQWWNDQMCERYQKEIDLLKDKKIDLAFLPLDPRLENNYLLGLDYFLKTTDTKKVVPMHLWDNYIVFEWLQQEPLAKPYLQDIIKMTIPGETYQLQI